MRQQAVGGLCKAAAGYIGAMVDLLKVALDALKLGTGSLLAIALVCGILVLGPAQLLELVGVAQLAQDYRPWLGLALVVSGVLLLLRALALVGQGWRRHRGKRKLRQRLRRLTEDEKQILRFYVARQTRTNYLRFGDGVVRGLEAEGIIYRASTIGSLDAGFAYNIGEVAWDCLNEDHSLLQGVTNLYRSDGE